MSGEEVTTITVNVKTRTHNVLIDLPYCLANLLLTLALFKTEKKLIKQELKSLNRFQG